MEKHAFRRASLRRPHGFSLQLLRPKVAQKPPHGKVCGVVRLSNGSERYARLINQTVFLALRSTSLRPSSANIFKCGSIARAPLGTEVLCASRSKTGVTPAANIFGFGLIERLAALFFIFLKTRLWRALNPHLKPRREKSGVRPREKRRRQFDCFKFAKHPSPRG